MNHLSESLRTCIGYQCTLKYADSHAKICWCCRVADRYKAVGLTVMPYKPTSPSTKHLPCHHLGIRKIEFFYMDFFGKSAQPAYYFTMLFKQKSLKAKFSKWLVLWSLNILWHENNGHGEDSIQLSTACIKPNVKVFLHTHT